jgi:hypothetical protein
MTLPIAPEGFQGDLTDPITGERLFRIISWWELLLRQTSQQALSAPIQYAAEPPPPASLTQWVWTADGYFVSQVALPPAVNPLLGNSADLLPSTEGMDIAKKREDDADEIIEDDPDALDPDEIDEDADDEDVDEKGA